jgi:hypothetical protein
VVVLLAAATVLVNLAVPGRVFVLLTQWDAHGSDTGSAANSRGANIIGGPTRDR